MSSGRCVQSELHGLSGQDQRGAECLLQGSTAVCGEYCTLNLYHCYEIPGLSLHCVHACDSVLFCQQLQKLQIIPFDEHLDGATLTTYKVMWANNGDCLSRQYTGTAAMKVVETSHSYYMYMYIHVAMSHGIGANNVLLQSGTLGGLIA